MKQKLFPVYFFLWLSAPALSMQVMDKVIGVDAGVGVPQLLAVQVQTLALPRFQMGLSYGMFPGSIGFTPKLSSQNSSVLFPDGNTYSFSPKGSVTLLSLCPFIRYFPKDDNFYFQFTYSFLRARTSFTTGIKDAVGTEVPGATLSGTVNFTQDLPTLSMGHIFANHLYSFNISLGVSLISQLSSTSEINGDLGFLPAGDVQNAVDSVQQNIQNSSQTAITELRRELSFIPSLMLSFGFFL
jgi:hypothetical protein